MNELTQKFWTDSSTALEILKTLGAVIAFLLALWQYSKGQHWKRQQYLSTQIEKFNADVNVQLALQMLDWYERRITLPDKSVYKVTPAKFRKIICDAEASDSDDVRFNVNEAWLRDSFGAFLDWLARFDAYECGELIDQDQVERHLGYWLKKFSCPKEALELKASADFLNEKVIKPSPNDAQATLYCLWRFIEDYDYKSVDRLLERHGHKPTVKQLEQAKAAFLSLPESQRYHLSSD